MIEENIKLKKLRKHIGDRIIQQLRWKKALKKGNS